MENNTEVAVIEDQNQIKNFDEETILKFKKRYELMEEANKIHNKMVIHHLEMINKEN